jgi:homoserine O-succinyltransferase
MYSARSLEMTIGREANDAIEVALVNNMADQALAQSWDQFTRLTLVGVGNRKAHMRGYWLPGIPRSDRARHYLEQTHNDISVLYATGADVLIVTGAEPRANSLKDEPYWDEFTKLVEWAQRNTVSALWSCLAAHGTALHLDGIERRRAPTKVSGVYHFSTTGTDWLTRDLPASIQIPHSRYNGLAREDVERRGYVVSSCSATFGLDTFWRREPSLFVLLQGHPEYEAETLSREYRRDVLRFLSHEREDYPRVPDDYFDVETASRLEGLGEFVRVKRSASSAERLDAILANGERTADWADHAKQFFRNWFSEIARERSLHIGQQPRVYPFSEAEASSSNRKFQTAPCVIPDQVKEEDVALGMRSREMKSAAVSSVSAPF